MNRFDDLVDAVRRRGMRAVGLTDHGNLFGAIEFYRSAYARGVRPIIGCELYVAPESRFEKESRRDGRERGYHLTVLAISPDGYRNLVKLSSYGYTEGFYYNPRVDRDLLDAHSDGLVAFSGCMSSEVCRKYLEGNETGALEALRGYREIFGKENYFIELQDHGLREQRELMKFLLEASKREGIPTVATNDVHYLDREDAAAHDALLCIGTRKFLSETSRKKYGADQFYLKTPDEMARLFGFEPAAVRRTVEIAERAALELDFGRHHLPVFPVPIGEGDENNFLREQARAGLRARLGDPSDQYESRLRQEIDVIVRKGFAGYMLIVADFIREAKSRGIPVGPGRGSSAGSLVAYALGITEVDPLAHGLIFERFLNPERTAMPDIDVDICQTRREEVIEYVRQRYGHDRVAQIITFGTLGAKAVIRDTARVLEIPISEVDRLAGLVPEQLKITLSEAIEKVPELKRLAETTYRDLLGTAQKLEGLVRHASRHAAGIVIGNVPITEVAPLYRDTEGHVVTQYDMTSVEALGLLKIDILGLKTLSLIARAVEMIGTGFEDGRVGDPAMADPEVYGLLGSGRTLGVFQLDSSGIRDLIMKLKPGRFDDLVALIALYRPGPMNLADEFVARRHGLAPVTYDLPEIKPILESTYGIILYQEQVMQIANIVGGFSLAEADNLRRAMGKKNPELMGSYRERFVKGARERGFPEEPAVRLFDQMERFAGYGFNKSHAVAYGVVAYQTAWLKVHHPVAFMAALLSFESDNHAKLGGYLQECARMGIRVRPPHVGSPIASFVPEDGEIRYGMAAVKNLGVGVAAAVAEALEASSGGPHPFASFWDFLSRIDHRKVNRRAVETLIEVGALDGLGPNRRSMAEALPAFWERSSGVVDSDQQSLFGAEDLEPKIEEREEFPDRSEREFRYLGFYLNGHPLLERFPELELVPQQELKPGGSTWVVGVLGDIEIALDKRGKEMARASLSSIGGIVPLVVFHSVFRSARQALRDNEGVLARGKYEESGRLLVDDLVPMGRVEWGLRLVIDGIDDEQLKHVEKTLARHSGGKVPVDLIVKQEGKLLRVATPHHVDPVGVARALDQRRGIRIELSPREK